MLAWFQKILPRTGSFFDQFEAHGVVIEASSQALARLMRGDHVCQVGSRFNSNARLPRRRHSEIAHSRSSLCSLVAMARNAPNITARSSSASSTSPAFATSPPSSIRCRVRSRRCITHSLLSVRRMLASSRCVSASVCRIVFRVTLRSVASLA